MCSYHSFSCQDFIDTLYLIKVFIEYATRVKCHRLKKKPPNFSCKLILHVRVCLYWYERDTQWSQTHSAVFRGSLIFKSYINNLFCLARLWTIYSLSLPEVKKTTSIINSSNAYKRFQEPTAPTPALWRTILSLEKLPFTRAATFWDWSRIFVHFIFEFQGPFLLFWEGN